MLEYTIEAYPDEDDDDDDTGDAPDGDEPQTPDHSSTGDGVPQEGERETQQTSTGGSNVEPQVNNGRAPTYVLYIRDLTQSNYNFRRSCPRNSGVSIHGWYATRMDW